MSEVVDQARRILECGPKFVELIKGEVNPAITASLKDGARRDKISYEATFDDLADVGFGILTKIAAGFGYNLSKTGHSVENGISFGIIMHNNGIMHADDIRHVVIDVEVERRAFIIANKLTELFNSRIVDHICSGETGDFVFNTTLYEHSGMVIANLEELGFKVEIIGGDENSIDVAITV